MRVSVRRQAEAIVLPVLGVAVALAAFELAPRVGLLPRAAFPPVSESARALWHLIVSGDLWSPLFDTLDSWVRAMIIATLIGVPLGLAIGASPWGRLLTGLTIDFLRPIPSVALIPILVLIYGTSPTLKVTLAVFGATFPLVFQAMYGMTDVDPVAKDTARAFGMGPLTRLGRVVLPSCSPYLATGLRISASIALILVVTGEYVVGLPGLGREVLVAQSSAAYDRMYAFIMAAGILGVAVNLAFMAVERRVLFWHPSQREAAA
ncbi:MAG TPA: ABC transporter permease [Acidimicrobiales bacterium]|jgi:ABC-type nitrate/sulfonate/bicarbonate transport system permease component